jgi:hypothetical protein
MDNKTVVNQENDPRWSENVGFSYSACGLSYEHSPEKFAEFWKDKVKISPSGIKYYGFSYAWTGEKFLECYIDDLVFMRQGLIKLLDLDGEESTFNITIKKTSCDEDPDRKFSNFIWAYKMPEEMKKKVEDGEIERDLDFELENLL